MVKVDFSTYWFTHLKLNTFLLNFVFIILLVNLIMLGMIKFYKNKNINFNIDYFFALFNLCVFIPSIFLSNTMYTFVFLLEINSILILYKFSVSKYFFNSPKNTEKNKFAKNTPKYYVNMMFFQY
jgi:phosphatidylserine synthase